MREIKFRLWDTKEKIMLNIGLVDFPRQTIHNARSDDRLVSKSYVEDPNGYGEGWGAFKDVVIEQYTGLKDKNGVKIFEGDIVFCGDGKVPTEIRWVQESSAFMAYNLKRKEYHLLNKYFDRFIGEVIGNVHDNPKTMEVRE